MSPAAHSSSIPGYALGSPSLARSPVSLDDLAALKASLLFTHEDVRHLRRAHDVLKDQVEAILDVWYGFVGSTPHLLRYFADPATGTPDAGYLGAVRRRFGQWILDTTAANYDQAWLDYQHEIGLRHHSAKKNTTDSARAAPIIHLRHVLALVYPISATIKPFLAKHGDSAESVEAMHAAWTKSVLLQAILWSHPYVRDGQF